MGNVCGSTAVLQASSKAAAAEATAAAAAEALAASEMQLQLETDGSSELVTAYGLERAGKLLRRLAPHLEIPEHRWTDLTLVFCDTVVPHECVLQEAAIREVRLCTCVA